ncbi:hypothetical protein KMP13_00920 [Epibacterium ulvae]|nr:hypothetical protein [Epibacterium ulvae]MBT8152481.1 hypothetical protein [Epibacterium ulvae]
MSIEHRHRTGLPVGLGLAAGAKIWMTLSELVSEALENASSPMIASAVTM